MNGSTHPDYTDYFEILPSNKLAVGLWLESDRMRSLALTQENLKNQQEAVKQERRLRFDNQPYSTAIVDRWPQLAFENWQSSHSIIGSFEDLNAATLDDVTKFFRTNYAPNNAVLVIVGDLQIPATKKLIESYFGDIDSQPKPNAVDLSEPANAKPRSDVYRDAMARVPGVVVGYSGPKRHSPDYYAINMVDVVLTGGPSSRFELDLVKGKQSVLQVSAGLGWPSRPPASITKIPATTLCFCFTSRTSPASRSSSRRRKKLQGFKTSPSTRKRSSVRACCFARRKLRRCKVLYAAHNCWASMKSSMAGRT
jgi:predicted Zn-dependent peptidase